MLLRKARSGFRRFKYHYQPYYPGLFQSLDLAVSGAKLLLVVALFGSIFYFGAII